MSKEETESFLGVPVIGDIYHSYRHNVVERPREDFQELLKTLLASDLIKCFGWQQYTPYFNDGDTCEFSAGNVWFIGANEKTFEEHQEAGTAFRVEGNDWDCDDSYSFDEYHGVGTHSVHPTLGGYPTERVGDKWVSQAYSGPDEEFYQVAIEFGDAVSGGYFDSTLLNLFGDHCEITVFKDKILVDEYYHD